MNRILLKVAMLIMFILAILGVWAALSMTFTASVWNLILGVVGIFFFFRALELVDKINKLGSYANEHDGGQPKSKGDSPGNSKTEEPDITDLPHEE